MSAVRRATAAGGAGRLSSVIGVAFAAAMSCTRDDTFECSNDAQCDGGTCEPLGLCSFPDEGCDSGRRYGELSGTLAGTCVPLDPDTSADTTGSTSTTPQTTVTSSPTETAGSSTGGGVEATAEAETNTDPTSVDSSSMTDAETSATTTGGGSTTDGEPTCLFEGFDDAALEPELCPFADKVIVSLAGGELDLSYSLPGWSPEQSGEGGIETCDEADWTGVDVSVELVEAGEGSYTQSFLAVADGSRTVGMMVFETAGGPQIGSFIRDGDDPPMFLQSQDYDQQEHRFMRLLHMPPTTVAAYHSADGVDWQIVNGFDSLVDFEQCTIRIGAAADNHPLQQDQVRFDGLSICVP